MLRRTSPLVPQLALLLLSACTQRTSVDLSSAQASVHIRLDPFTFEVRGQAGQPRLTSLSGSGATATDPYGGPGSAVDTPRYQQQVLSGWDGYREGVSAWSHATSATVTKSDGRSASLHLSGGGADSDLSIALDGAAVHLTLVARALDRGQRHDKSALSFSLPPDEQFFGLGERFTRVNHRGLSLYNWAEEGGLGAGEATPAGPRNPYPNGPSMTYFPVPFLLSSRGYGLRLHGSDRSELHLGSERPDALRVAISSATLELTIWLYDDPLASLDAFTAAVGRPPIPAPWAFGPHREVGPGDQIDGVDEWRLLRQRHVPTTMLDDNVHFLPARSEAGREDALRAWTGVAHAAGFKVLGYYTPYVSLTLPSAGADRAEGDRRGVFVQDAAGATLRVFFSSGSPQELATIDLTNPDGVTFFQSLLSRSLDLGYDGWMHDFGEYLPHDARMHDGRSGAQVHNEFPLLSVRAAAALLDRERPDDSVFFARSGWAGSGGVAPMIWSGDPEASFDPVQGLPANLRAGLNLSMSGAPYWGSDVGGYKCLASDPNDKEMYLRWAALGAVSPLMLNDTACTAIGARKQKWSLWSDGETTAAYAAFARLHTRLQPYFLALARQAHATGRPLMLHPFLLFPRRPEAWAVDDAFFLGAALYAAPVVARGDRTKTVWLPPGRYVDLRDLSLHQGDATVILPAPLTELPLLLVAGQLLPLLDPSVETLAPATDPGVVSAASVSDRLDVQVALAPGQTASLTLLDGTVLRAERRAGPGADAGNPDALAAVAEVALAECSRCFLEGPAGPQQLPRVRANGALAAQDQVAIRDLVLSTTGPAKRRIRWEALRLP